MSLLRSFPYHANFLPAPSRPYFLRPQSILNPSFPDTDNRTLGKRQTKKEVENVNEYQLSAFDRDQTPDSKAPKTDRMSRKKFDFNDSGVGGGGGQGVKASPSYPNRLQDSAGADSHRSDPQDMKGNFYEMYDALLLDQTLGKTGKYYSTQKGSFV